MKALLSVVLILAFGAGVWGITPEEIARWKEVYTKNKEAAENGDAEAQATIGSLYSHGLGVPEDDKEAFKWYKKAAEQGLAEAQDDLGFIYYDRNGVPRDYTEAFKWFKKTAEQGNAAAQVLLGDAYAVGHGVIEDFVTAYAWWNIAAANGDEYAKEQKTKVGKRMTKEQIAKAQDLSREMIEANPKLLGD